LFISLKLTYESLIIYHLFVAILYDNGVIWMIRWYYFYAEETWIKISFQKRIIGKTFNVLSIGHLYDVLFELQKAWKDAGILWGLRLKEIRNTFKELLSCNR
jgi:hypothetical protein